MAGLVGALDPGEHERLFRGRILPNHLALIPPVRVVRRPVGIVVGGQTGAGQSDLARHLRDTTHPRAVIVDADQPGKNALPFPDLKRADPNVAFRASATDYGRWTEKLTDAFSLRTVHLVVQSTMGRFDPFRDMANSLGGVWLRGEVGSPSGGRTP